MRIEQRRFIAGLISFFLVTCFLHSEIITSDFEDGIDDWTVADLLAPVEGIPTDVEVLSPVLVDDGGNPGGAILQQDQSPNGWFFSAPLKFLGEKSGYLAGMLSWDKVRNVSTSTTNAGIQLILHNNSKALYYLQALGSWESNTWRSFSVDLIGSSFRVGSPDGPFASNSEVQAVLSNLSALYILGEAVSGDEISILDNVRITPPSCPPVSIRVSEVEICWPSVPGVIYQIDYRSDLTTNTWMPLFSNVLANSEETCVEDLVVKDTPKRFYRVVCPEP